MLADHGQLEIFANDGQFSYSETLRIEATGQQNPASTGSALVHDYFVTAVEP